MAVFGNFTGKKQTQSGVFKDYAGQENKANLLVRDGLKNATARRTTAGIFRIGHYDLSVML